MATKAEDPHVHEVVLEDGTTLTTGPPIEEPATVASGSYTTTTGTPGKAKITWVTNQEMNEITADPEAVRELRRAKAAPETPEDELAQVKAALKARNANALPAAGQSVWERMYNSASRFSNGRHPANYPTAIAWYAVRQKYHLEDEKGGPGYAHREAEAKGKCKAQGHVQEAETQGGQAPEGFRRVQVARGGRTRPARLDFVREIWVPSSILGPLPRAAAKIVAPLSNETSNALPPNRWQRHVKFILKPEKAVHRIAYGVAYMPWEVDLQGQYATEDQVLLMAHKFTARLATDNSAQRTKIGEMHRQWEYADRTSPGRVVESWVVSRYNDPDFPQGWIVGVKTHPEVWTKIQDGSYTGFSIGGKWGRRILQLADEVYARMPERMAA